MLIVAFASCAGSNKTAFTQDIRNKLEASNIDISSLQYYISNDVTLSRELANDFARVQNGELYYQNGKYYETIKLKANTPGVCLLNNPRKLNVAFEADNGKFLQFAPTYNGVYQLVTSDVNNRFANTIFYNGVSYLVNYLNNPPMLMIKANALQNVKKEYNSMKGRRIGG